MRAKYERWPSVSVQDGTLRQLATSVGYVCECTMTPLSKTVVCVQDNSRFTSRYCVGCDLEEYLSE